MPDRSPEDSPPDAFERSLDDMLERVSASTHAEHATPGEASATPATRRSRPPIPPRARPEHAEPRPREFRGVVAAVAALLLTAVGFVSTRHWPRPHEDVAVVYEKLPPPSAGVSLAQQRPQSVATAFTQIQQVAFDTDASTEALMVHQLGGTPGDAGAAVAPARSDSAATFAVLRYDALIANAANWRIVAPLNVEEVYVLVPAMSPLRDLSDLRGRRINVGMPGSARSNSGEALYHALFGEPIPTSPLRSASKEAALQALASGGDLDALILFDGQPSSWLASLHAETRQRLKVLSFDASGAASRRVSQAYLKTRVAPALAGGGVSVPTLGEVSFLVASTHAANARQFLESMCERLPALRARGHPKWQEVSPSLQLPVSMPRDPGLSQLPSACETSVRPASPILSLSGANP